MAKRSFGKGSIADLVREAEETQKAQEDLAIANASASEQLPEQEAEQEAGKEAENSEQGQKQEDVENNSTPTLISTPTPTQEQDGKTKKPVDVAPVKTVDKSVYFSAENILSKDHKYKNARQQVNISEDFYCFLKAVSKQYDITIAQMINNMLRPYFADKSLKKDVKLLAQKKYRELISRVDDLDQ
jgi:hypothetical protein